MAYETKGLEGQTVDVLTQGDLRIQVTRVGAELVSLARSKTQGAWVGFLYRDGDLTVPATGWKNHATVMGYFLHRLKNERSLYRGQEIRGGNHSFLRNKIFAAPEVSLNALCYRLTEADIEPEEYPFPVDFQLTYRIVAEQLEVEFLFENRAPDLSAHLSFGLHPGFGVGSVEAAEINLPAGKYRRHLAPDNFLSGETVDFDHAGGPMPFSHVDLPGSFLLEWLEGSQKVIQLFDRASGKKVELDFTDTPYFTLWSDGSPMICIEPCWGLPDHHVQRPFEEKLGIQVIPPRGTLRKSFSIKPILA